MERWKSGERDSLCGAHSTSLFHFLFPNALNPCDNITNAAPTKVRRATVALFWKNPHLFYYRSVAAAVLFRLSSFAHIYTKIKQDQLHRVIKCAVDRTKPCKEFAKCSKLLEMLHLRRLVEITIKARIKRGGSRSPLMASARHRNRLNSPPSKALIYMLEHTGLNLPSIHPTSLIYKSIFGLQT